MSKWIEESYINEFLDLNKKIKRLEILKKQASDLSNDINRLEKARANLPKKFSRDELRWIKKNSKNIGLEGTNFNGLRGMFNELYNKDLNELEFGDVIEASRKVPSR